jgi:hypothetical protein
MFATNLIVKYSKLLEIMHLNEFDRKESLRSIFNRDIQENADLKFLEKVIRPLKIDGQPSMETLFNHLIKEEIEEPDENGNVIKKRIFEKDRSMRLHWVRFHLDKNKTENVEIFSVIERDQKKRKDVTRTYVYDLEQEYVVVLEPQNSAKDYYLLTAYHLNKDWSPKSMKKKMKNKLPDVY